LSSASNIRAVITDLVLERDDSSTGIHLIESIKKQRPNIPIMVLSAFFQNRLEELTKLGVDEIVDKSDAFRTVDGFDEFAKRVQELVSRAENQIINQANESELLKSIRALLIQEIEKYAPIKERTIIIPGEGQFELIKPLIGFKKEIESQLNRYPYNKNVFLMMKFRPSNIELSDFIIESLHEKGLRGVRADHEDWNLTRNVYNPIAVLYCCKYGIALFDEPEPNQAYSANVAYELGMMHYQNKDCLILKHATLPSVPFDLIKDLHVQYDRDLTVRRIITSWIKQVAQK
jgi:CheY-like chemotaxis protein